MIGLLYLLFFAIYLWLSVKAVKLAARWAKGHGHSPRLWGFLVGLVMYSLVFWDLLPAFSLWGYECATRGGFMQYKTLEQWKRENPGVAETLHPIKDPKWEHKGNLTRVPLNQRFVWEMLKKQHLFRVSEREERIIDTKTGEVMARYVDFGTNWFRISSCETGGNRTQTMNYNTYLGSIRAIGRDENGH